jgi:hypothetical protein
MNYPASVNLWLAPVKQPDVWLQREFKQACSVENDAKPYDGTVRD